MREAAPTLIRVVELIHKLQYLRTRTSNIVLQAECEEKLLQLFDLKKKLEEPVQSQLTKTGT